MGERRWIDEIRERAERQEHDCEDVPALLGYARTLEQKNEISQRTIETLIARLQVEAGRNSNLNRELCELRCAKERVADSGAKRRPHRAR